MDDDSEQEVTPPGEAMAEFARSLARVWAAEIERVGPDLELLLAGIAITPEARTARRPICAWRPCHCLCGHSHPDDMGVCDGEGVTTRRYVTEAMGPVDVVLCAPCVVAQGLTELSR